jgi:hypothetical protein
MEAFGLGEPIAVIYYLVQEVNIPTEVMFLFG